MLDHVQSGVTKRDTCSVCLHLAGPSPVIFRALVKSAGFELFIFSVLAARHIYVMAEL